jgi:eukaryotic-like serine/threonine-protein kinase
LSELTRRCAAQSPNAVVPPLGAGSLELIERADEQRVLLDLLDDASAGSFRFIPISGATGLGKSVLLDWARAAADRRQLTVFHSRTRFSERVPFNAIDGIVDDLAALLERFPGLTDDPDGRALRDRAGAAFGVLRRASDAQGRGDPRDAFDALIALLSRCTLVTGRLVLLCDDLQWSDADSIGFLRRLMRAAPADMLLIATVRDDTHTEAFREFWPECRPALRIELKRLSDGALAHIIGEVAADAGRPIPESAARLAATACDGRPLLAVISGRVAARTDIAEQNQPISWLLSQYAKDASPERYLLSLLAVLDGSAALPQLARMTGMAPGALDERLAPLVRERLILAAGSFGDQRFYDFSHDLIRRQALELLGANEVKAAHAAIADHTEFSVERAATLVRHLLGAERWERAAETAAIAAREAEGSRAYGLAAELYEIAIQQTRGERDTLRLARAVTLERSGRYVDAAREYRRVADARHGEERIHALLQQAKALLATEHISEGRDVLRLVQSEQQERSRIPERWANIATAIRFMLGPWAAPGKRLIRERPSTPADERDVFLGTMIGFFNPIAGVRHMLRARKLYREAGNRIQAAEVDYVLAYVAIWSKMQQGDTSLGERFARSARDVLGGETRPEHGRPYALDWQIRGMQALHVGDWTRARDAFEKSIDFYEAIGRKLCFEHLYCWIQLQFADRFSQNLPLWSRTLDTVQQLTDEGQDSVLRWEVAFARNRFALMMGDLEEASRLGRKARDAWPKAEMSYQSYVLDFYLLAPEIYQTDGVAARERFQQVLKKYARLRPGAGMFGGDMLSHLAWFEAAALRRGLPDASYKKIEQLSRRAENACPLGRHMAMRALAYAADYVGKPEDSLVQLARAEQRAAEVNQMVDVAIARFQRGIRLLGSEGKALVREAEQILAATGAHPVLLHEDPARR